MKYDIIIIGAGIVGLASALKLKEKKPGLNIAVLEKENKVAKHQTGNNSGVIHAGVYYKPGSLKAVNNSSGYRMLLDFCDKESVPYKLCGKLIVATEKNQLKKLDDLYLRGLENGLNKIKKLKAEEIKQYEPYVLGQEAIWVPYTGIIDYGQVCEKYAEILVNRFGVSIFLNEKVLNIKKLADSCEVITPGKSFETKLVINTAGLYADEIASFNDKHLDVKILPFRGEYYIIRPDRNYLVNGLIYPVPDPAFPVLGVHFTKKLDGAIEAGPNAVLAFKKEGYRKSDFSWSEFSDYVFWKGFLNIMRKHWKMGIGEYYRSFNKSAFTRALQKLIPDLRKDDLITGGAGVRALAADSKGGILDDFLFIEEKNILNVLNAPSPAATASLAVGNSIAEMAIRKI